MTGHGDVQTGVKAMKSGAVDFLLKPFTDDELLDAVQRALVRTPRRGSSTGDRGARAPRGEATRREKEVCTWSSRASSTSRSRPR
jgi:FixJ family two-component response regulator